MGLHEVNSENSGCAEHQTGFSCNGNRTGWHLSVETETMCSQVTWMFSLLQQSDMFAERTNPNYKIPQMPQEFKLHGVGRENQGVFTSWIERNRIEFLLLLGRWKCNVAKGLGEEGLGEWAVTVPLTNTEPKKV